MRIAVIGPQNTGKSTFIKDFLEAFPQYSSPTKTYRDFAEEQQLAINQKTSEASQRAIGDFLFEQTKTFAGEHAIFDRCVIDNWVYTMSQYLKGEISEPFLEETEIRMHEDLQHYDTIFFIPTASGIDYVDDGLRDVDRGYIDHINTLFIDLLLHLRPHIPHKIVTVSGPRDVRIELARKALVL